MVDLGYCPPYWKETPNRPGAMMGGSSPLSDDEARSSMGRVGGYPRKCA